MGKAENNGAVDAEKVTEDFTSLEEFVSDLSSSSSQITQDEQNDIGASMLSKNETVAKKLENQNKSADISICITTISSISVEWSYADDRFVMVYKLADGSTSLRNDYPKWNRPLFQTQEALFKYLLKENNLHEKSNIVD